MKFASAQEVSTNPEYKALLTELLYQLADDDFLISYRGSEWLGLAPHIEEDVAFSSITQNTMGHAAMYYELLEELGEGKADDLAHGRKASERRNAILLEEPNGPGHFLNEPNYDWAYAVVRNYFYEIAKNIRIDSLKQSSYEPLAHVAAKVKTESIYHLLHWKTWFNQLLNSTDTAKARMVAAIDKVWDDMDGVITLGPQGEQMTAAGIIDAEDTLRSLWVEQVEAMLKELGVEVPGTIGMKKGNGRLGEHTQDLDDALAILSEVYNINPAVPW